MSSVGESLGGSEARIGRDSPLPPIDSIWESDMVSIRGDGNGWDCKACGVWFKGRKNSTKATDHLLRIRSGSVRVCTGKIP